jgi:hypothetical protein
VLADACRNIYSISDIISQFLLLCGADVQIGDTGSYYNGCGELMGQVILIGMAHVSNEALIANGQQYIT